MAAALTPGIPAGSSPDNADNVRRTLRRELLARRLALPVDEWQDLSSRVRRHLDAQFPAIATMSVGFFWPHKQEPDLRPLIETWLAAAQPGFRASLPVVTDTAAALIFRRWTPATPMSADRHGIPTPADGDFLIPAVLLIPVNGFDAAGYRLGYGGGYYDRTLAWLRPRPLAIGIGFDLARLPSLHRQPHDQPLDAIVTESGVCRPAR